MLVGAILAAYLRHAKPFGMLSAVLLGIVLAGLNLWMVLKAGSFLAGRSHSNSESTQDFRGKVFCLVCLVWAGVAEYVGYKLVAAILILRGT